MIRTRRSLRRIEKKLIQLTLAGAAGDPLAARGVVRAGAAGAAARLRPPVHVLPRARVPAVRRRAQGGLRVPAVRHARVPQAALLSAPPGEINESTSKKKM